MRKEEMVEQYARDASIALMRLSGGGSEMFKRIGEDFYADPNLCVARVQEKLDMLHREVARTHAASMRKGE